MNDNRAFWHGALVGLAAAAVLVGAWLGIELSGTTKMYEDLGTLAIPAITRLVLMPAWRFGVPSLGAVLLALVVRQRPRATAPYALIAIAMIAGVLATWHFAQAPIYELSDKISE